jgi:hypothetical protein
MPRRKAVLAAIAAALPTSGDGVVFKTATSDWEKRLAISELPAAIVRHGEEEVPLEHQSAREKKAFRELPIEVEIRMKAAADLAAAMDDYCEAVEQVVMYDAALDALLNNRALGGVSEIEYDDESEKPVASMKVRFTVIYSHWPADPATDPVPDPYAET